MIRRCLLGDLIDRMYEFDTVKSESPRVAKLNFAGVLKKDIKVIATDKTLEVEGGGKHYRVYLEDGDDVDNLKVKYNSGLLVITIDKKEDATKEIPID